MGIENPLEWLFLVSFSIIEDILLLYRPLEMLSVLKETTKSSSKLKARNISNSTEKREKKCDFYLWIIPNPTSKRSI